MNKETRRSGLEIIGDVPWGTHFCQFYQTREDLLDVLVPYFKAGLESNEYCMWVTSEPLGEKEAADALRKSVPDLDRYREKGQIEIIPHTDWYLKGGSFDMQRVLNGWVERLNQALARGYEGLRLTGNTFWLEKTGWSDFTEYEAAVNGVIGGYSMIALCSYSLDKCGASEVIDVVQNHQFALIKREGKWTLIESAERKRAEAELKNAYDELELKVRERTEELVKANERLQEQQKAFLEVSVPVVQIWNRILLMPLIGIFDSKRAQLVMEKLLSAIEESQAKVVILDISGIPVMDTLVAKYLLRTVSATTLMGTECVITGIRAAISQTVVQLGVDLSGVVTKTTLDEGIRHAFELTDVKVVAK